jgi:O-methyltransferase involved in polyketide biosynthesis
MHFELRYWSIDQLLKLTNYSRILELSSGYSLRGLDLCVNDAGVHFIDTDLPEIIATKQQMIDQLQLAKDVKGKLELLPLNALDEQAFNATVNRFSDGPLAIVNEGLLMYLNLEEKKQLCKTIHSTLKQRGGCWITADVYVKRSAEMQASLPQSKSEATFMEQHNIEENKFDNYEAAENSLKNRGLN